MITQAHNKLLTEFDNVNVTVVTSQSLTNNVSIAVERLKEKDVRIILGNFNETWARRIFCEAYRLVHVYVRTYPYSSIPDAPSPRIITTHDCFPNASRARLQRKLIAFNGRACEA